MERNEIMLTETLKGLYRTYREVMKFNTDYNPNVVFKDTKSDIDFVIDSVEMRLRHKYKYDDDKLKSIFQEVIKES